MLGPVAFDDKGDLEDAAWQWKVWTDGDYVPLEHLGHGRSQLATPADSAFSLRDRHQQGVRYRLRAPARHTARRRA